MRDATKRSWGSRAAGAWAGAVTLLTSAWVWAQATPAATPVAKPQVPSLWRESFHEIMTFDFLSVPLWRIGLAMLALMLGVFLRTYLLRRLLAPFRVLATKTETDIDERLIEETEAPMGWLLNVLVMYLGLLVLQLPKGVNTGLELILRTVGVVFLAWMLYRATEVISLVLDRYTQKTESRMDGHLVPLVRKILRVTIVLITIITIIQQWGYDVTSLIAGLGLGGLAFALAAQQTLANLFGSIMIFTDRPFSVGDWIKTKHGEGVVEEIGLRSTKVRTFTKSLISVPNADIASAPIENFSEMNLRRIKVTLGLTYTTTPEQLEYIVDGIKELIRQDPGMYQEAYYVNFVDFNASSLDVLIYCFTNTTAWGEFMDIRQRFYLNLMRLVERAGSGFAFPSQSLYVETPMGRWAEPAPGRPPMHEIPPEVLAHMRPVEDDDPAESGFGSSEGLSASDGE